jgi:TP901 family phage tail tape measure protein
VVVEELIAKVGLKFTGASEAKRFGRDLDSLKKKLEGFGKGAKLDFGGATSGLPKTIKDFEKATSAARRYRQELERSARVRPGGGYGPTVRPRPGRHPGGVVDASMSGAGVGLGRAGVAAGGAYTAGAVAKRAVKSSMDFERSMIEVTKATDATPQEREDYAKKLMKLATETGKNKEELAGMLSAAGFAGRPKDELMRFTEFGAKASSAWGTTPDATGQAMAEIGNIYEANQAEIERIGDQINTMADKSASKESDLLEILRRVGGTGRTAGMTSGDILGFGAGLKERGVQTEIASGGIEDYINFLKLGDEYSKGAEDGIKALGYTSDKLRKAFVAKPTATALEFLDKIKAIKDPMKRAEILTGIFGKTRQDDVERLASSSDKIRANIEMINNSANYKGSVTQQFFEQMQNDVSKIDQSLQQWDVLLKRLGDPLKQLLGYGAGKANAAADYIDDRTGNKTAKPSNVFDDLPGLDHLRPTGPTGVSSAAFDARFGNAAPSAYRRSIGTGRMPNVYRGKKGGLSLGYENSGSATTPTLGAGNFGLGGARGPAADWLNQGVRETATSNITNNTNVGNDQRTQSVTTTVNATGLAEVGALVKTQVQAGLASMGPSIVKANAIPTSGGTAASPAP